METLERFRGHFYNWYDTRTLEPLNPKYVSSVDSGNLAGSLLTLQAGLLELKISRYSTPGALRGIEDTLLALAAHVPSSAPEVARRIAALQGLLQSANGGARDPRRGAGDCWTTLPGREGIGGRTARPGHGRAQVLGADAQPAVSQVPR